LFSNAKFLLGQIPPFLAKNTGGQRQANMFPLFSQLPRDIRRMIWLATLGPMTLRFTQKVPGKGPVLVKHDYGEDNDPWGFFEEFPDWEDQKREEPEKPKDPSDIWGPIVLLDDLAMEKLFANFPRYVGHVALADGGSRLQFVVEPSGAYLACKESRAFLSFIFAELVRPSGGLPSWFRFDTDTICCTNFDFYIIRNHAWFAQTQHLVIAIGLPTSLYFELGDYDNDPSGVEWDVEWIARNLPLLKNIVYEMKYATTYEHGRLDHWLDKEWFDRFEEWYNCKYGTEPVSWCAQVISQQVSEEEWLTPTNYLRVYKLVQQKRNKYYFPDGDWKKHVWRKRSIDILEATDEKLENPTEFFKKHRPLWDE
jgi:hypothetical protein